MFFLSFAFKVEAQSSSIDLIEDIHTHRQRLFVFATSVYEKFPHEFPNLHPIIIKDFMRLHDAPKLMNIDELRALGYTHDKTIIERLQEFVGKNKKDLHFAEKERLLAIIKDLNDLENKIKLEFFQQRGWSLKVQEELARLDHLVDTTDTGIYRRKELRLKRKGNTGADFLISEGKWQDIEMAQWLERHHKNILRSRSVVSHTLPRLRISRGISRASIVALFLGTLVEASTQPHLLETDEIKPASSYKAAN